MPGKLRISIKLLLSLLLIFSSMANSFAGIHFGLISAIKSKAKELKEKKDKRIEVAQPLFSCGTDTVDDADGNTYNTVEIGGQCWMAENLNYDGDPVGNGCKGIAWVNNTDVGWCGYYPGGPFPNEGLIYQWSAAMNGATTPGAQGLCPSGWHVPSDVEYQTLEIYLGMCPTGVGCADDTGGRGTTEGDEMKKAGLCEGRNPCGTSGFEGLLTGYREPDGSYLARGTHTYLWSSTPSGGSAWRRRLSVSIAGVSRFTNDKAYGFSVRCLKD